MKFNIYDGDDYWSDFEEYLELYNRRVLSGDEIRMLLGISQNKLSQYRKRAISEGLLDESWKEKR